jgi:hypothetical protein
VDANKNVYDPEDILANKINPRVIMKLEWLNDKYLNK